jgi:hypothetical protein
MSDIYHVVVLKTDGSLVRSDKEKESSAIKSAKMYVTVRGEPAAVVITNGRVAFAVPEGAENDADFMKSALEKAREGDASAKPTPTPPKSKSKSQRKPAAQTPPAIESNPDTKELFAGIAQEYNATVKKGKIAAPVSKPKPGQCSIEILESACTGFLLSRNATPELIQRVKDKNRGEIEVLAGKMATKSITQDEAVQQIISTIRGIAPMTPQNPKETQPAAPGINLSKVLRGHTGAIMKPSRIREDLGLADDLEELLPTTLPDGIVIRTTKSTDEGVHGIIAFAMGYTPASLINPHKPSTMEGYDYQRSIPLTRPDVKHPTWRAMGERIQLPSTLIKRIQDQFPDTTQVRIEVAQGIDLDAIKTK